MNQQKIIEEISNRNFMAILKMYPWMEMIISPLKFVQTQTYIHTRTWDPERTCGGMVGMARFTSNAFGS